MQKILVVRASAVIWNILAIAHFGSGSIYGQAAAQPLLKYTLALKGTACVGREFDLSVSVENISGRRISIDREFHIDSVTEEALERLGSSSIPELALPDTRQSFSDGLGPKPTITLKPGQTFKGKLRIAGIGLNFYWTPGAYIYTSHFRSIDPQSNFYTKKLVFRVKKCE